MTNFHDSRPPAPAPPNTVPNTSNDIVTVCAWCPELHIMRLPRVTADRITILIVGSRLVITRNGTPLGISHGICEVCKAKRT